MKKETSTKLTEKLKIQALKELESAQDLDMLQDWRINYLGRKGKVTQILRGLSDLSPADRRQAGSVANETRKILESSLDAKEKDIRQTLLLTQIEQEQIDVTLPGLPSPTGKLHIITQTLREICAVFSSMGFEIAEGPEVELDRYNFEMLNIPSGHPARDMWNSLWINQEDENGNKTEPYENVVFDVPTESTGAVTEAMGTRKGIMTTMAPIGESRTRIEFKVPSRGLIGYRSKFLTDTRGEGLMSSYFAGYGEYAGKMLARQNGALTVSYTHLTLPTNREV